MPFTDVAAGTLTLTTGAAQPYDRCTIALSRSPEPEWARRFNAYAFSRSQLSVPPGILERPQCDDDEVIADIYPPSAATTIGEIKAAIAAANSWYKTVQEPANTAAAALASAAASALAARQTALRALLSAP